MFTVEVENAELGNNSIILKVKGVDEKELFYRINRTTPLKKLMNNFCDRLSKDKDTVVFLFDGRILSCEKTSDELGLKDGDEIKAEQREKHITLMFKDPDDTEVLLRAERSTLLKKLMNSFCDRVSVQRDTFVFLLDDRILSGEKTLHELGLKDGDEIDAMLHQTGGC